MIHTFDEDTTELVARLAELRAAKRQVESEESRVRNTLVAVLQQHQATKGLLASGAPGVSLSVSERVTVNSSKLAALYPDIFEECKKVTEVTTLRLD